SPRTRGPTTWRPDCRNCCRDTSPPLCRHSAHWQNGCGAAYIGDGRALVRVRFLQTGPMSTLSDEIARRRTFAIISHPDAGKTTLTEKLLLFGGAIQLAGEVKARGDRR